MAFTLGNFNVDEVLYAVAEDFDGNILYSLDQLSSASIEVTSDSTDITDKYGNVVRTIYKTKSGTFTATNAFLHPQIMAAGTGASIDVASSSNAITMPKIQVVSAGATVALDSTVDADTIAVIGLYGSGANSDALTKVAGTTASDGKFAYDATTYKVTVPAAGTDKPVQYLIKYNRTAEAGMKIVNSAKSFPDTVKLTLYVSIVDPCDDQLRAAYVVLPSFQASPETTISLSADEQTMDFTGAMQTDYCSANQELYIIYFPDEDVTKVVVGA